MLSFKQIICPVDLSGKNKSSVALASLLAKENQATLIFLYVAPQWVTEKSIVETDFVKGAVEAERQALQEFVPTNPGVKFEHRFVFGNPGPEIVKASTTADLIVMSTHGYSGLKRFLMGSVAEYVTRYATCPVISFKCPESLISSSETEYSQRFVTGVMHHVAPIHLNDPMESVVAELRAAKHSAAPVASEAGVCIGILTETDLKRFEDKPILNSTVQNYYTSAAITISENQTCFQAQQMFEANAVIHHLVVVNHEKKPLGIVTLKDLHCGNHSDN